MNELFARLASRIADLVGSSCAFLLAVATVAVWAVTGPLFGFSDTWQLVINTGTTIVTFLMVFLIQNTQNRDAKAMQLKLDELLRAVSGAREELVDLERASDEEIEEVQEEFRALKEQTKARANGEQSPQSP
ncbi:MAG: low affinity iron permease family protein [Armatimonadetes bacterium]|nr:low affinity iron permease family protein [Armatimonadota bacterium]